MNFVTFHQLQRFALVLNWNIHQTKTHHNLVRIPNSKLIWQAPRYQETTNFAKGFFSNIAIGRDGQLGQAMLHILLSHIALCHTFHLYCFSLEKRHEVNVWNPRGEQYIWFPLHQYDFFAHSKFFGRGFVVDDSPTKRRANGGAARQKFGYKKPWISEPSHPHNNIS